MKLLLDTHTFLWLTTTPALLSTAVSSAVIDPKNECFLSIASLWEMAIKGSRGKLNLPGGHIRRTLEIVERSPIQILPVDGADLPYLGDLPLLHRDPFDRMLVSQALRHDMTLVTVDSVLKEYGVPVLWD